MTLKLHLPPEHDVAMPETVKVCQSLVECETGTVPLVGANGAGFEFGPPFSLRGPLAFPLSMATGDLELNPGAVRLLRIQWPLDPKENNYQVDVRDANGVQTGKLNNDLVSYTHVTDQQCGVDYWTGSASD